MIRVASGILLLCIIHAGTIIADESRPAARTADLTIKSGSRGERLDSARQFQSIDAQGGHALVRDLKFTHLTTNDGLSQGYVTAILQDRRGFMWFATRDGLNRYDGNTFVVYKQNPSDPGTLGSNFIQDLIEDDHGDLWMATNVGVDKFDVVTERFTRYLHDANNPNSLGGVSVKSVARDSRGDLWFGTEDGGLDKFDPAKEAFTHYRNDREGHFVGRITRVIADSDRDIWFAGERGLFHLNEQTGEMTRPPATMNGLNAESMCEDEAGNLWLLPKSPIVGLVKYDPRAQHFTNYPLDSGAVAVANSNLATDGQNGIWVPSSQGLYYFDRRTEHFTYRFQHDETNRDSLDSNAVLSVYRDRGGVLWVGTENAGLNILDFRQEQFVRYLHRPADPNSVSPGRVKAIYGDTNGVLWLGFFPRALDRFDRKTGGITRFVPKPGDENTLGKGTAVTSIYKDAEGYLWIGCGGCGLDRFDERTKRFKHYRHKPDDPNSLISDNVYTIYGDRNGQMWVGQEHGVSRFDPVTGGFSNYRPVPDNPASLANSVWLIYQDRSGALWLGTWGGELIRLDDKTKTFVRHTPDARDPHRLNGGGITAIHEDRSGTLWVGAFGGLYRYNRQNETFTRYTEAQGLPSSSIRCIAEDGRGRLWLSTQKGISRFDPRMGTFRNYDVSDGLQSNEFSDGCYEGTDREIFFGSSNGFNSFFPDNLGDNPYVPPVVITSLKIFNKPVPIGANSVLKKAIPYVDSLTLTYRDSVFSFEFAALSYANSQKNRFRYKLDNFEPGWNEVDSKQRLATYTNLDPGKYVFRVQGSNSDGIWNEEGISLPIVITPPWWRTNWFRALCAAVFMATLWAAYQLRMMQVQRESRRLRDVIETIPAYVWSALPDGFVDFVNRRWLEFSGFSLTQALGWGWTDSVHPEDRGRLVEGWRAAIASGNALEEEARMRGADGQYRWLLFRSVPQRDRSGKIVKWYGKSMDIDDRKRAEETLRESETRFRTYIDQATDAFFALDFEKGTILDVNRQACEYLGYTREELVGKTVFEFDAGLDPEWLDRNVRPRLEAGESVTFETRHRRKDGSEFPVEIRARAFQTGGRVVNLSLVQDITERKRAEEERERLHQMEADLAHLNRVTMMGELAASVAHEVNQPLTGIVSNGSACLRLLTGDTPDIEEAVEALRDIVRDGRRAGEIIKRIRALTKRAETPREKLGLNETIQEVLALVGDEAKKNSVRIRTQFADEVSPVNGDRVQLQQVLLNLLMNAIQAMSSVNDRERQVVVTTRDVGQNQVQVTVEDSGPGLDADKIAKIFEPFYTTKATGMGMGLSICRSIVQNHGGRLWATVNEGPGASFHFTLPKDHGEETTESAGT